MYHTDPIRRLGEKRFYLLKTLHEVFIIHFTAFLYQGVNDIRLPALFDYMSADGRQRKVKNDYRSAKRAVAKAGLQYDEAKAEVDASLAEADAAYRASLEVLALETAMRRGELAGLRWDQVDLPRRVVRLEYEAHETMAIREMRRLAAEAEVDARVAETRADAERNAASLAQVQDGIRALQEEINRRAAPIR